MDETGIFFVDWHMSSKRQVKVKLWSPGTKSEGVDYLSKILL